jgi:uncharacterized membrane protein affecting hemolysin expression
VISLSRVHCEYPSQKKGIPAGAILLIIVGVSILIGIIVVVLYKNNRLKHQYTNLLTQSIKLDQDNELEIRSNNSVNSENDGEKDIEVQENN